MAEFKSKYELGGELWAVERFDSFRGKAKCQRCGYKNKLYYATIFFPAYVEFPERPGENHTDIIYRDWNPEGDSESFRESDLFLTEQEAEVEADKRNNQGGDSK